MHCLSIRVVVTDFFFFKDSATTEIYTYGHTLSLHDALPIWPAALAHGGGERRLRAGAARHGPEGARGHRRREAGTGQPVAVEGQVRPRALRRHAAARRPRARLRHRRRHPADGRALLGARPADPRPPAGRVAGAAAAPEEDHHLREP